MDSPSHTPKGPAENALEHRGRWPATTDSVWALLVCYAADKETEAARSALEELFRRYFGPVFAFVRNSGVSVEDAKDLTQEFFTDVMMRPGFKPTKESGKFRSLLYASLQNHLLSWHRKGQAKKRGGDYYINSLDEQSGDHPQDLPSIEPVMRDVLDRLVAEQVWELARERLRTKYDAAGKKTTFVHLINNLGSVGGPSNAEIANVLEMTEDSVKQEKTKMRRQLKECFYQEVALEFPNPLGQKQEIEQEVLYLRGLLYSPFFEIRSLDC